MNEPKNISMTVNNSVTLFRAQANLKDRMTYATAIKIQL